MPRQHQTIIPQDIGLSGPSEPGQRRPPKSRGWISTAAVFLGRRMLSASFGLLLWLLLGTVAWVVAPAAVLGLAASVVGLSGASWSDSWREHGTKLMQEASGVLEVISEPSAKPADWDSTPPLTTPAEQAQPTPLVSLPSSPTSLQ